jgi:NitT/TauT family transport system substrate-binding protein
MRNIIVALLLALGVAASPAATLAQERGQVRLGYNRAWVSPALLIGLTQGHFKQAGVNVVEKSFDNPADIVLAIASGDLDAGVSPAGILFTAVQRGVKVKAVGVTQGSQSPPIAFKVRTDSGINSIVDLRGKAAAVGAYGGNTDLYLRYWLTKAGLDPKADMRIMFVPFHLTLSSLINGQINVGALDPVQQMMAEKPHPGQLRTLFTYEDVTNDAIGNTNTNGLLLVFGNGFVERDRDTAVRVLEGYLRAIKTVHEDPKRALDEWALVSKNDVVRMLRAPATLPSDGKVYLDEFQFEADMALRYGYLKQPIDVRSVIDNSLLDEAARRAM